MILYHLDRHGSLKSGEPITFVPQKSIPPVVQDSEFLKQFHGNISNFGLNYLCPECPYIQSDLSSDGTPRLLVDSFISEKEQASVKILELVFELVREAYFPNKPSRFTSLFAVKEKSDFQNWSELNDKKCFPKMHVLKIDVPKTVQKFDANFLRGGLTFGNDSGKYYMGFLPTGVFDFSYKYWSGCHTELPRWEYLIPLPILGNQVSEECC